LHELIVLGIEIALYQSKEKELNHIERQSQTTSNRGTESHGSLRDRRVAEIGSKVPDYRGFIQDGNPVFILMDVVYE